MKDRPLIQSGTPAIGTDSTPRGISLCSSSEARKLLPYEDAARLNALPFGLINIYGSMVLSVGVSCVDDPELLRALKFRTGAELRPVKVDPSLLQEAIFCAYHGDAERLAQSVERLRSEPGRAAAARSEAAIEFRSHNSAIPQLAAALIDYAVAQQASDLHISPRVDGTHVLMRIKGELLAHGRPVCSPGQHQELINRIKVLAALDLTCRTLPQDGAFSIPLNGREASVRVSIMPTVHGEKAVLRFVLGLEARPMRALGLEPAILDWILDFMQRREGMLLLSGPTGSGKSTTMYSIVDELSRSGRNCVSIEDPVEAILERVSQTALNAREGLDYHSALRSVLRQDPEVILLGEIRDAEGARAAVQAALTGHLVISTVHARDLSDIVLRMVDLGVELPLLLQALSLAVTQRLIPRLCAACKVIDLQGSGRANFTVYQPVGCKTCDYSGYDSRILVSGALRLANPIKEQLMRRWKEGDWVGNPYDLENCQPLASSLQGLLEEGLIAPAQLAAYASER